MTTFAEVRPHRWRYRAANDAGAISRGHVIATDADEARAAVRRMSLIPLELTSAGEQQERKASISTEQLALGLRILADLFDAGLPITRVLATFESLAPPEWKPALPALQAAVREGRSFAHALDDAPIAIPALVTGMLAAGEAGSGIAPAVRSAADLMESAASTRAAVRAALTYPLILAGAGVASIGLLVGVVLPRFAEILSNLGQEMPPSTRLLIRTALVARTLFLPALFVVIASATAWYLWVQTPGGRKTWHRFLLGIPGVAMIRMSSASSRASTTLSALLTNGVVLPLALVHAARATGDAEIGERLARVRTSITRGHSLAHAVAEASAMTATTVRLIGAGEQAGKLPEMLLHASRIEQDISDRAVRNWVKLLEPALVLTFAAIVGLVAAALLQAVYSVKPGA